jgi:hypothetical protein
MTSSIPAHHHSLRKLQMQGIDDVTPEGPDSIRQGQLIIRISGIRVYAPKSKVLPRVSFSAVGKIEA